MATLEAIRERLLRARALAAVRHEDEIVRELDEELQILSESRPGTLPWKRAGGTDRQNA